MAGVAHATPLPLDSHPERPYAGQLPDARRAGRRQRLLDSALELYGTVGFNQVTITQLCREARVAPRQFYEEFPSQEALLMALCQILAERQLTAVMESVAEAHVDMEARARAGISAYCHAMVDDVRWARVLCIEVVGVSDVVERAHRVWVATFGGFVLAEFAGLGREVDESAMAGVHLATMTTALTGGVHEALVKWLFDEDRPDIEELIDTLTVLFVAVGSWLTLRGDPEAGGALSRGRRPAPTPARPSRWWRRGPGAGR